MLRCACVAGAFLALVAPLAASEHEAAICDGACLAEDDSSDALSLLQRRAKATASVDDEPELECVGDRFFDCFNFFTLPDPTNGYVKYVDWAEANRFKLLRTNYSKPDDVYITGFSGIGLPAMSVRLESKRTFNGGLFVLDVAHVPTGPGTWPAFWLHGDNWPMEGEFDMFESVNNNTEAKTSVHTSPGCLMSSVYGMDNGGNGNENNGMEGAGVWGNKAGKALNDVGGGVIAVWWLANGFSMYHFSRDKPLPQDLVDGTPDPSSWGRPWRFFPFGSNCASDHFKDMRITLNLAYCGEWAGRVYPGGNDACIDYVKNNNDPEAYWLINSLRVFPVEGDSRGE